MPNDEALEKGQGRKYQASKMLQQKVGSGPLDEATVERMQVAMDTNEVDFAPLGMQFLNELEDGVNKVKNGNIPFEEEKKILTSPVMQLKANAAIFHYTLIGSMANVMLSFLEAIKEFDKDAIEIVAAHHTTLKAIVLKKMSGDGGAVGEQMVQELKDACARYYAKKKKS